MAKKWSEVIASPEFQKLSPEHQEAARAQYWNQVVVPQIPEESLGAARAQFDAQYGPGGSRLPQAVEPAPAAAPEDPYTIGQLGRQLGLTARHAIAGAAAIPAMASDAVTGVYNTAADAVAGKGNGFRFQSAGQALQDTLTKVGLPEPGNKTERIVGDAASAVAGLAPTLQAGQQLAAAANPVIAAVGRGLAAGPRMQAAAAASGAAGSSTIRENGGSVAAQMVGGLGAALLPSGAPMVARMGLRGALRGGEAGRQRVEQNIELFRDAAGTTPSIGQATESRARMAFESGLAKVPGGAGIVSAFSKKQADDMKNAVQSLSDELAPGANATRAGEAIERGISAFKSGFRSVQSRLYDELEQVLPKDVPITVDRTRQALAAMNEGIEGAPALSQWFRNAKIGSIEKSLISDLELAATPPGQSSVMPQAPRPAALPFAAIRKLRTLVGNEISDGSLVSDVPRSKWRALYGALSEDLGDAAKAAGPRAEEAWTKANEFTAQHMQRLDELSSVVKRDAPERVFAAALSGANEGATVVKRVMSALPPEEQREVAAAVLQRMGRATPGNQNAMGDEFSSDTFLTNLAKLNPEARDVLFGKNGKAIGQLGKLAELRREGGRVFANPSGTGGTLTQMAVGAGIGSALLQAVTTGNVGPLATAVSVPAGAAMAAKAATSPSMVEFAASRTAVPKSLPAAAATAPVRADVQLGAPSEPREAGGIYATPRGQLRWNGSDWEPIE